MPFIHIRALPLPRRTGIARTLAGLTRDFAAGTGIGLEHVTATWTTLRPGSYALAGNSATTHDEDGPPVLVEILAPDFNDARAFATMMRTVADSLSRRIRIPRGRIFIECRQARSGYVFDAGAIAQWD